MADNSGTESHSSPPHKMVGRKRLHWRADEIIRKKRALSWAAGAFVLVIVVILASWLAHKQTNFPLWHIPISFSSDWFIPWALAAGALLALLILWKAPQWQVGQVKRLTAAERFDRVNEARKTLATILGGIVLLAGFFGTWQNIKVAQQSLTVSQQGQITDRFTKAIEQLGAVDTSGRKKLEVRLGGIYALERIANESERDHWPIMEVLCTYVRENSRNRVENPSAEQKPQKMAENGEDILPPTPHPEADIQAILTVLGRRDRKYERAGQHLDLRYTDIRGAGLEWANLTGAYLPTADLSEAYLMDADLGGADLTGAFLINANLSGADLRDVKLMGAALHGTNLTRARLIGAKLIGANVSEASLVLADLSGADLFGADLRSADLSGADLRSVRYLAQQQIDTARGDVHTRLPADLHMPERWKQQR